MFSDFAKHLCPNVMYHAFKYFYLSSGFHGVQTHDFGIASLVLLFELQDCCAVLLLQYGSLNE